MSSSCADTRLAGAVLAAGRGSRMCGGYDWLPKTLLPVGGRPLLARQLGLLRSLNVQRAVVLVGHLKDAVLDYVETTREAGLEVELVEQPVLRGPGHGLLCLRSRLKGPFVLFLGDIFILPLRLADLVEPLLGGHCAATLAAVPESDPARLHKNFRVDLDAHGRVARVVEKPTSCEPALKGCGVYAFTPAIFTALERTPPDARGELGITEPIQTLIELGYEVRAACVSAWDANVTTADDLAACNRWLLEHDRGGRSARCSG